MSELPPQTAAVNTSLVRVHRGVLVLLALCALVIASAGREGPPQEPEPVDESYSLIAVVLALGSIVTRRAATAPATRARSHLALSMTSLFAAAGIGVLGMALAAGEGERQTGLLYVLAGAILALRPPTPVQAPDEDGER